MWGAECSEVLWVLADQRSLPAPDNLPRHHSYRAPCDLPTIPPRRRSVADGSGRSVSRSPRPSGRLLVVDDNSVNRRVLQRALEALGHETVPASDGRMALSLLDEQGFEAVLLDIEMPVLDGFETLQRIKANERLSRLPVIMVSGLEDIESVVRCIDLGAVDYLTKPFNKSVLRARVDAALAEKRTRDAELDLLDQVNRLVEAAAAIEKSSFEASALESVAVRDDAIGVLGRVFLQMAERVVEREQRLTHQISQLRRDVALVGRTAGSPAIGRLASYLAVDRRLALSEGRELDAWTSGTVLLSDISGFTAEVIARSEQLGSGRGAEELLSDLNDFYDRCVHTIHRFGGSVVGFAGDGITSWFDDRDGSVDATGAAIAAGIELQRLAAEDESFGGLKIAVASGSVHRLTVGDPDLQLVDVLWGAPVVEACVVERDAGPGELLAGPSTGAELASRVDVRFEQASGQHRCVSVGAIEGGERHENPWPPVDLALIDADRLRRWLIPAVFDSVVGGHPGFLAELRSVTALFVSFDGVRFDSPDFAARLDEVVRWIQTVVSRRDGSLLQLTPTDAGGYFYISFGAPSSVQDDAAAALACAVELVDPPVTLDLGAMRVGLARGPMRIGGYGGADHTTYGAIGRQTNLAARLMQAASPREILADDSVLTASGRSGDFEPVDVGPLKGIGGKLRVYRFARINLRFSIDDLEPSLVAIVKIASIFPRDFDVATLDAVHPDLTNSIDRSRELTTALKGLCESGVLATTVGGFVFSDERVRVEAHGRLLFTQRRSLHRAALQHLGQSTPIMGVDPVDWQRSLAYHAEHAEDQGTAAALYEQAARIAQANGRPQEALELSKASLRFELGDRFVD